MTFKEWYEFNKDIFITSVREFTVHVKDKDSGNVVFEGYAHNYETKFLLETFGKYKMSRCIIDSYHNNSLLITLLNDNKPKE